MIHLEEVSPDNRRLDLHVRNDQKDFAANSITLLARAYAYRNSGSRALIYTMKIYRLEWLCIII